jgi:hypothetical protein
MIVKAAPINALTDSEYLPKNANAPNSIPSVAVTAAPLDTPRINGSAS